MPRQPQGIGCSKKFSVSGNSFKRSLSLLTSPIIDRSLPVTVQLLGACQEYTVPPNTTIVPVRSAPFSSQISTSLHNTDCSTPTRFLLLCRLCFVESFLSMSTPYSILVFGRLQKWSLIVMFAQPYTTIFAVGRDVVCLVDLLRFIIKLPLLLARFLLLMIVLNTFCIGLVGPLQTINGYTHSLICVHRISCWVHAVPFKNISLESQAQMFTKLVVHFWVVCYSCVRPLFPVPLNSVL